VDEVVGVSVRWQPIAFAFVIQALDRTVLVDGEPYWGDDRLELAAARLAA
jgi:hypothetical protein